MSIGDSLKKMIGIEELDDEITEGEIEAEKAKIAKKSGKRDIETEKAAPLKSSERYASASSASSQISGKKERRFTVTSTSSFKMVLLEPKSFEECPRLVDSLKSKKPVIINLERIDMELARKIFDFLKKLQIIFLFSHRRALILREKLQKIRWDTTLWRIR